MISGCVTLDEVFAAAGVRAASLVPETSGYLALAVGDATSRLPYAIDERVVTLTTEGAVGITRRGALVQPHRAAESLRGILARLLAVSTGSAMPGLSGAARPRQESERGVESVIEEIEAALIPVNRGAARRALARLARETMRARDLGHILPPRRHAPAPEPPAPPPRAVAAPRPAPPPPPRPAPPPPPAPVVAAPPPPAPPPPRAVVAMAPVYAPARQPIFFTPVVVVSSPSLPFAPALTPSPPIIELPLPPGPPPRDPTPTMLGVGAVEIRRPDPRPALGGGAVAPCDPDPPTEIDVVTAHLAAEDLSPVPLAPEDLVPARDTDPTLGEPLVLAQPTEDPALAFGLPSRTDALTPPFPLAVEARALPAASPVAAAPVAAAPVAAPPRIQAAEASAACVTSTRTDDLLARFGASCSDDQSMREAAAGLRRIAGVDPATPPPQRSEVRAPLPPPPAAPSEPFLYDWETPEAPLAHTPRRSPAAGIAVAFAVLLIGVAGGGAVMRYRPDLLSAIWRVMPEAPDPKEAPAAPNAAERAPQAPEKDAPATTGTPATVDQAGTLGPAGHADRPGVGARAERSGAERARPR
jgi:hypothetical protein